MHFASKREVAWAFQNPATAILRGPKYLPQYILGDCEVFWGITFLSHLFGSFFETV